MKKPRITEGKWWAKIDNSTSNVVDDDNDTICAIHSMGDTADARAISAVPDMIDALIDVLYVMQKEGNGEVVKHQDKSYVYFKAKDALKKAGCTDA